MLVEKSTIKTGKKAGEVREDVVGYYGRLLDAVDALHDRNLRLCGASDVEGLVRAAERLSRDIERALMPEKVA